MSSTSRIFDNWVTQARKGVLELGVINSISGVRVYGYDIVKTLNGTDGLVINDGTIYPILSRLKREGLVATTVEESPDGPARKYYHLTAKGDQLLTQMNEYWSHLQLSIDSLKREGKR